MPLAKDIATELRKLADALDRAPEADLSKPTMFFTTWKGKQHFLNAAKILPRPFKKTIETCDYPDIVLEHDGTSLTVRASIQQSAMRELIEPAKPAVYKCHPILSAEEDAALSDLGVEA